MAKAMSDEEDRSGKAAASQIPDEFMKVAKLMGTSDCLSMIAMLTA
jgi:hypothetical protein